jgi:Pentapeptide repeats (8 copies)
MFAIKTGLFRNWLLIIPVIFIFLLFAIINTFVNIEWLSIEKKIEYGNKTLTTAATIFIVFAVIINAYYAAKYAKAMDKSAIAAQENNQLTEKMLIAERFRAAIQQLGNKKIETRLGAIYTLELIAKDSAVNHWTIMEILTAFVRENTHVKEGNQEQNKELPLLRADVQTVLTVIGRRDIKKDPSNQKLDLGRTDISGANLREAKLQQVNLREANLQQANLFLAKLNQANLIAANLQQASLFLASLNGAILSAANLNGAILSAANLQQANLSAANLQQANLSTANLQQANLSAANLQQANLSAANLQQAILDGAKLQGADLTGVKNLKLNQITSAYGDSTTRLPENLKIPKHWM